MPYSHALSLSTMAIEPKAEKPHVLMIPYPGQGHINPVAAFAKYLSSKGILITFITTTSITTPAKFIFPPSITIATISDGSEKAEQPATPEEYFKRFKDVLSHNLAQFIDEQTSLGCCPKVIIYDSTMPFVLDIAHDRGLLGASFFTQSCAVSAIFSHLKQGLLGFPYGDFCTISLPSLPLLEKKDLPAFDHLMGAENIVGLLANQFSNLEKVDWIFFNTFDALEIEVLDGMRSQWPIKTVGPTFLLQQGDNTLSKNYDHAFNLFEPNHEACINWLDSRETGSVVYVSFGSVASPGKEQMEELAFGLIKSNCYFLWVVRSSQVDNLPPDFTTIASEKGLIVEWCHQPEVLAHRALACFVTHCGWNSTLEAVSNGVPLIAMARFADQMTNSKFIEDVWRVGVRVRGDENGIVGREEVANCIKKIVDREEGTELKKNACKWKELANEAVGKGGTSSNNIEDFICALLS